MVKEEMSQYIRCKRKNQTVFLHVETFTTFQEIKKQLAENFSMEPEKIVLWASDKVSLLQSVATFYGLSYSAPDSVIVTIIQWATNSSIFYLVSLSHPSH